MSERPRTLEELNKAASYKFAVLPELHTLVRGVQDLLQQAKIYEDEQDVETAYILVCRSYKISLEDIPKHPDFQTAAPLVADRLVSVSSQALQYMQKLKPLLESNYNVWLAARRSSKSESQGFQMGVQGAEAVVKATSSSSSVPSTSPSSVDRNDQSLRPTYKSQSRPQRRIPVPSLPSPGEVPYIPMVRINEPSRPTFGRIVSSPGLAPVQQGRSMSVPGLVQSQTSTSRPAACTGHEGPSSATSPLQTRFRPLSMPPESSHSPLRGINPGPAFDSKRAVQAVTLPPKPLIPPPAVAGQQLRSRKPATMIPIQQTSPQSQKTPSGRSHSRPVSIPIFSETSPSPSPPLPPRNSAPASPLPASPLIPCDREQKSPRTNPEEDPSLPSLRTLVLPSDLIDTFSAVALPNTEEDIETCGLIMGRLAKNTFVATLLVIPKQHGTSDTCTTRNEEEILLVADRENAITLGWIHTHPSHDCFLSSRDLHTQAGYQQMLPEAIAIVVAPTSEPSIGIFRLTDPPGLQVITQCQRGSGFHPHPNVPLYTQAHHGQGGHVMILGTLPKVRLVDLR